MKKSIRLFILFLPFIGFSQEEHQEKESSNSTLKEVVICMDEDKLSFHSHSDCIGLETCESEFNYVDAMDARKKYARENCCICWDNPGQDCKNDNPDYYSEEGGWEEDPGFYVDDLWWLDGGTPYFYVIAIASSIALLSNEIYVGASYPFLPPKLTTGINQTMEPVIGASFIFRKNFNPNALEYGFSTYNYSITEETPNNTNYYDIQNYVINFGYLHKLNQHLSTQKDPLIKLNLYAGPTLTYGWNFDDGQLNDRFGIGGTMVLGIPLGKRVNLDLRGNVSNYSSDFSIGFRWLYQRNLPWNR